MDSQSSRRGSNDSPSSRRGLMDSPSSRRGLMDSPSSRRRLASGASSETDIMVAQSLAAVSEPRGEPRRPRAVSGLNIISMTAPMEPPATRDAMLRGILKPEVIKPSTPDLRLAQKAAGVIEVAQSIRTADELLASLQQVEITLRIEVERAEEALRKHTIDPDVDPAPAPDATAKPGKKAAKTKEFPVAEPAIVAAAAPEDEEPPETDPDRLTLLVEQTLESLQRLRGAGEDGEDEEAVERLREAQQAGTRLLVWLAGATRAQRRQCDALAARRATRLRAEAMSLEATRTRQRYVREGAAARAAIVAQEEHSRDARETRVAARALAEQHMHSISAPYQRTFVECAWREKRLAAKRQKAAEKRREYGLLLHQDIAAAMKGSTRASAAELQALSASLNRKMHSAQERDGSVSWFKLFNTTDDDGSGQISFVEFAAMVREELALSLEDLPERKLMSIWLALDEDNSGLITAGEFGAFVRLGEGATHTPTLQEGEQGASTLKFVDVAWRARMLKEKQRQANKVRRELGRLLHQDIKSTMEGVPPATAAELQALSVSFNRKMLALQEKEGGSFTWFKLFKRMDDDGSGQISYVEFAGMVREQLGLSLQELPERKLMSIWLALDEDNSGLITAGELGAYLRGGEGAVAEAEEEDKPIKAKLYFPAARGAEAKRKGKATRTRTGEQPYPGSFSPPHPLRPLRPLHPLRPAYTTRTHCTHAARALHTRCFIHHAQAA